MSPPEHLWDLMERVIRTQDLASININNLWSFRNGMTQYFFRTLSILLQLFSNDDLHDIRCHAKRKTLILQGFIRRKIDIYVTRLDKDGVCFIWKCNNPMRIPFVAR